MAVRQEWKSLKPAIESFGSRRLLVVGDLMQDVFIWGRVRRISPEAPVPVVETSRQTSMLGGAANVVNNLVALGAGAAMAGAVGADRAGKAVIKQLDRSGVERSCVVVDQDRPTTVKTRIIAHSQQVVRFDKEDRKPVSQKTRQEIQTNLAKIISDVDGVIISDYAKGVLSEDLARSVIETAIEQDKPVAVDPKVVNLDFYRQATIVTPNHREAGEACGMEIESKEQLAGAGKALIKRLDCRAVLITRGEHGMSLFEAGKKAFHVPTLAREVFDVTGAGDTVIAALALGMVSGLKIKQAVELSNLAAGIAVGKLGTSVVSAEELARVADNGGL